MYRVPPRQRTAASDHASRGWSRRLRASARDREERLRRLTHEMIAPRLVRLLRELLEGEDARALVGGQGISPWRAVRGLDDDAHDPVVSVRGVLEIDDPYVHVFGEGDVVVRVRRGLLEERAHGWHRRPDPAEMHSVLQRCAALRGVFRKVMC